MEQSMGRVTVGTGAMPANELPSNGLMPVFNTIPTGDSGTDPMADGVIV
jgi:hypothetical protein